MWCYVWYICAMSEKHSAASRARMAKYSREELSKRMSSMAHARWSKMGIEQRRQYALKMVGARKKV